MCMYECVWERAYACVRVGWCVHMRVCVGWCVRVRANNKGDSIY